MPISQTEPALVTYLHQRGGRLGLPIGGTFELTGRCNFDCPMCYVHRKENDHEKELTADQWIRLAEQAKDAGLMFALLTGGEPFLRKDFFQIYGAMKSMGLMVSINSNGSMLRGDVLEKLLADPPFRINISLYGGCEETYRAMCGQDAYTSVVENIRTLKQAGVDVRLNLSITPHNRQDIRQILEVSRELGVHVKASAYMYPPLRLDNDRSHRLSPQDAALATVEWDRLRSTAEDFIRRAENHCQYLRSDEQECPIEMDDGVSCRAGRSSFWITWDGKMLPCGMMDRPAVYPLETGFLPAWQQLLEATRQIRMSAECVKCPKRPVCGICASVALAETGAFDQVPRFMCEMTDATLAAYQQALQNKEQSS